MAEKMNKQKYIRKLEEQNGYCECPQLQGLYSLRRETEALSAKCDFFRREADLKNPRESDLQFLEDYEKTAENLCRNTETYYTKLTRQVEEGHIYLILHELRIRRKRKITIKNLDKLHNPIVAAHCAYCKQQIDVLD